MTTVAIYNMIGEKVGEQALEPKLFGVTVKPVVVHQVAVAQRSLSRTVLAHTKDRSDVSGGGRKPWQQKGTGRARHGSTRSPIWRGGGVTFGPTNERNFATKVNKRIRQQAMLMCLSDKAANEKITLVDQLELKEMKTRKLYNILQNLGLRTRPAKLKKAADAVKGKTEKKVSKEPSVLLVLPHSDRNLQRSARNIQRLETISANSLNVMTLLEHDVLLLSVGALKEIEKTFVR